MFQCISHALSDPDNECLSEDCHLEYCHGTESQQCLITAKAIATIGSIISQLEDQISKS